MDKIALENIKNSFSAVRTDVTSLKDNVSEWFTYFEERLKATEEENAKLKQKIAVLEDKFAEIDAKHIADSLERENFIRH